MDASTRQYVLKGKQVSKDDFTPEDWLVVIGEFLSIYKSNLKYWPGFTPICELKVGGKVVSSSVTSFRRMLFPGTFCLFLLCYDASFSCSDLTPGGSGEKRKRVSWSDLLLSRKGEFIERKVVETLTYYQGSSEPESLVESCRYELIDDTELLDSLRAWPSCSFGIVAALHQAVNRATEIAEERYLGLMHQRDRTLRIIERIEG